MQLRVPAASLSWHVVTSGAVTRMYDRTFLFLITLEPPHPSFRCLSIRFLVVLVFSMPPSALPILILRSTAPSGRRAVRVAYGPGLLDRASSSGSNFTFSFLSIFLCVLFLSSTFLCSIFCLQLFFLPFFTFLPEFLCEKVFSKFSIS